MVGTSQKRRQAGSALKPDIYFFLGGGRFVAIPSQGVCVFFNGISSHSFDTAGWWKKQISGFMVIVPGEWTRRRRPPCRVLPCESLLPACRRCTAQATISITSCNQKLQLQDAIRSCNNKMQSEFAITRCNQKLQPEVAIRSCNYKLQLQDAIISCNGSNCGTKLACKQYWIPNETIGGSTATAQDGEGGSKVVLLTNPPRPRILPNPVHTSNSHNRPKSVHRAVGALPIFIRVVTWLL